MNADDISGRSQAVSRPLTERLKDFARRVPLLFRLAGLYRRRQFKRDLALAEIEYSQAETPAIPPPMLRYRVHGSLSIRGYSERGRATAAGYADVIRRYVPNLGPISVLDFGSGPGRVITALRPLLPEAQLFASDIDAEAIGWAKDHLGAVAEFSVNRPNPPSDFATASMDVIYSNSLFTHLDEKMQMAWLDELARILRPGGVLLATYHGDATRSSCTPEELKVLDTRGFLFKVGHTGQLKLDGLPDFYQTTFHTAEYVRRNWTKAFELLEQIPSWLSHQDLAVLRRASN